jgi:heat shock protein HslJ
VKLTLLAIVLALAACTAATPPAATDVPGGDVDLDGGWQLEEGTVRGQAVPIIDGHRITLTIDGSQAGGIAACNHYGASLAIDGDEVRFTQLSQTDMACEPTEAMVAEQSYLAALGLVNKAAREGKRLVLSGADADLRYRLLPPVPEAALIDTEWILESVIHGEAVSSTIGDGSLELRSDGAFVGSTGCRRLMGRYIVYGDTIQVTEMGADGDCPAALAEQDSNVIGVIEGPFTVDIEGATLTITAPGNQGLVFRAAD